MGLKEGLRKNGQTGDRQWVSGYQDPFHNRVASIIDPITALRTYGKLNYGAVADAQRRLEAEVATLAKDQEFYSGLGASQAATVSKSRDTLDPIIAAWRASLTQDLSGLKPPDDLPGSTPPGEEAPTAGTVLGTPGTASQGEKTLPGQGLRAAQQQRKRAAASGGRTSTILGGSQYQQDLAPRTSLLGY